MREKNPVAPLAGKLNHHGRNRVYPATIPRQRKNQRVARTQALTAARKGVVDSPD
jgi:hypothetical protein